MPGLKNFEKINNKQLCNRILMKNIPMNKLANEIGIDQATLRRALGVKKLRNGRFQNCISCDLAERIIEVLDIDPVEVGL